MHILLIHQNFAALNEPGGTRHHELARYLVEKGHRVTVISSAVSYLTGASTPAAQALPEGEGLTLLRVYTYSALHRSFVHRVFSFISFMLSSFAAGLRVRQVDLVWGTSPPIFQGATAWALAHLKGVPFVFEVRDLWPAFAIAVGVLRQPLLIRASEWLERFLYRRASRVVVNSPGFVEHVRQRGARQVDIVPNGADPRMFDLASAAASGAAFRKQHGLEGKFIAMYAGAHGMSNDLGIVLEAARLLQDLPQVQIVFLGDGKDKPALKATAAEMRLGNVCFLAPIPKTEMDGALGAADACIAILKPIRMYETVYPNKVFDYMAAGKPVLLAIGGVIRQVIEEGRAGLPVTPGDPQALAQAVRMLAEDPAQAAQMGLNGRRYIEEHFDRARLADQLEAVFQSTRP